MRLRVKRTDCQFSSSLPCASCPLCVYVCFLGGGVATQSKGCVYNLAEVMQSDEENQWCADCGSPSPLWCSTNLGVFLCVTCASVHRALGADISKVWRTGTACCCLCILSTHAGYPRMAVVGLNCMGIGYKDTPRFFSWVPAWYKLASSGSSLTTH